MLRSREKIIKILTGILFVLSGWSMAFAEEYSGSNASVSNKNSVRGRVISIDKEKSQITVQDSNTGTAKTFTSPNAMMLNTPKEGEQVEVYLTSTGLVQSIIEK